MEENDDAGKGNSEKEWRLFAYFLCLLFLFFICFSVVSKDDR